MHFISQSNDAELRNTWTGIHAKLRITRLGVEYTKSIIQTCS